MLASPRPRRSAGRRRSEEPDARGRGRRRLAQLGLSTADAVGSLIVGSLIIAGPVVDHLLGGAAAKARLGGMKNWLPAHNDPVMAVLFLRLQRQPHRQGPATAHQRTAARCANPAIQPGWCAFRGAALVLALGGLDLGVRVGLLPRQASADR
jgi:hypothetical protein